ncbi:hypothetical protein HK104_007262 [Borealophlyctis nickersoniae]|nr:hypothetical protein HK104_007262 [Borealophlyctis nickersoniae]
MKQFGIGENLTMKVFRLAYGIELSWEHVHLHNGSLASEMIIEDRMGHSFRMHQRKYNLTALENGEAVGESDDEDEDEEMGGASEEVVAEDASDEVAPEDASDEEGNKCWIDEEGNWWGIDEEGNKCWIDEEGNKWWV